jgi:hypothetical protein
MSASGAAVALPAVQRRAGDLGSASPARAASGAAVNTQEMWGDSSQPPLPGGAADCPLFINCDRPALARPSYLARPGERGGKEFMLCITSLVQTERKKNGQIQLT